MSERASERVAVYIDFDNVVISRYDEIHGKGAWRKDDPRESRKSAKLTAAKVDIGAVIDFAASFGTVSLSRAYADWSVPANAAYQDELVSRAIDLVQLFHASGTKNGADIRLAVDALEDLMRDDGITHVVLVAGDSDFIPLAQRCRRLGRTVVGVGVAGSSSRALIAACNEFSYYADLPGTAPKSAARKSAAQKAAAAPLSPDDVATELLVRAVTLGLQKSSDDWIKAGGIKSHMQRLDPAFKEKSLGFSSFRAFVESRSDQIESKLEDSGQLVVRLAEKMAS